MAPVFVLFRLSCVVAGQKLQKLTKAKLLLKPVEKVRNMTPNNTRALTSRILQSEQDADEQAHSGHMLHVE